MWFSFGSEDIAKELRGIHFQIKRIGNLMASIAQVRADYKAYAQQLRDQRDEARAQKAQAISAAEAALAREQAAIEALQAFQDDDAATDAQQLLDQQTADAAAFESDLNDLKALDTPAEPVEPDTTPQAGDGTDEDAVDPAVPSPSE